jgi:VWFA-related protein
VSAAPLVPALLLAGALAQEPPAPGPTFASAVESVYVDAFVMDKGRPVTGLRAQDFELRDNGVPQQVELMGADRMPLTSVLVFDTSGSVAGEKLDALRTAGAAFLDAMRPEDEVGLLTFNHEIRWQARPGRARRPVLEALSRLHAEGATAVFDALYAGLTMPVARGRGLVVLFSDGVDTLGWLDADQVRRVAERSNMVVHAVGLRPEALTPPGAPPPPEEPHARALRELAESTGGRYWEAEDPARLRTAFTAIALAMSTRYVLGYAPSGVPRDGWHTLELRLRGRGGSVHARRGYWVAPAPARR